MGLDGTAFGPLGFWCAPGSRLGLFPRAASHELGGLSDPARPRERSPAHPRRPGLGSNPYAATCWQPNVRKRRSSRPFRRGAGNAASPSTRRADRPSNLPVTALSTEWVSLDGERIGWGAFQANRRCLRALFVDRIKDPLAGAALADQETLFRLHSVLQFLGHVEEMFDGARDAHFTEGEAEAALEEFRAAPEPVQTVGRSQQGLELRAATPLVQALRAWSDQLPGAAIGYLERALDTGRGSWVVTLLSDGSRLPFTAPDWTPPAAAPKPATPNPDEPLPGGAGAKFGPKEAPPSEEDDQATDDSRDDGR